MLVHRPNLRTLSLTLLAIAFTVAAHAQTTPEAAVTTFMDGFNTGNMAKASAVNSASGTTIIDEFAPYTWTGPKAFDNWGADFGADSKAIGRTEPMVALSAPIVSNVSADHAYLIYPALYTYKLKGVSMHESAHMAFALHKEASAWRIAAWSWTGTVPKPVK